MTSSLPRLLSGAAAVLMLGTGAASARDADTTGFSIEGNVRVRAEAVDGQVRPGAPADDAMLSFRTLINARYDFGGVHVAAELDDARSYFQKTGSTASTSESNALEPLQAYLGVDLGKIAGQTGKGVVRAGRFTLNAGSGRLVDRPDWSNSPASFLGIDLNWSSKRGDRVQLFYTQPFDRLPSDAQSIRDNDVELDRTSPNLRFGGFYLTRAKLVAGASLEGFALWLDERDSPARATRNRDLFTFGGRFYRAAAKGKFDFEFEGAIQHGTARASTSAADVTDRTVRAGMANVDFGYTFATGWTPRVSGFVGYASGETPDADYTRFDPLFGGRRGDFGPLSLHGPVSWSNIVSPGLAVEAKPSKDLDFAVKGRKLLLASATDSFAATSVRDATGRSGRDAGAQVEGRVRYWIVPKKLRAEGGAAWLFKGRFLTDAPNAPRTGDMRFGYLTITTFF